MLSTVAIVAGAALCACAWRWRGSGHLALGRILCAGLIAVPSLWHDWPMGLAVGLLTWAASCLEHDPGGKDLEQNLLSGVLLTGFAALAALAAGNWAAAGALAVAGLLKGPLYRLPEADPQARWIPAALRGRFLYRELAFGAAWGAAVGNAFMEVLR